MRMAPSTSRPTRRARRPSSSTDIESLISKGANVLIVLALDSDAILPAVKKAGDEGIPVIAYDRLIENPNALYITFDNIGVGRMMAKEILKAKPAGNYAFIKGDKGDPNATSCSPASGSAEAGDGRRQDQERRRAYTDGWKPDNAQKNMEQILTKNNNKVDAVVSENDGMAGGVVAALKAQGMAGSVPVSGQDGDHAAINRIALGTQTVSIWKDARDSARPRPRPPSHSPTARRWPTFRASSRSTAARRAWRSTPSC